MDYMRQLINKLQRMFNTKPSKNDRIAELQKIPTSEWERIWHTLNIWEFPEELKHIKPTWWDNKPKYWSYKKYSNKRFEFITPLMEKIAKYLRYHE